MAADAALKLVGQALPISGGNEIGQKIADAKCGGRFGKEKVSQPIHALEWTQKCARQIICRAVSGRKCRWLCARIPSQAVRDAPDWSETQRKSKRLEDGFGKENDQRGQQNEDEIQEPPPILFVAHDREAPADDKDGDEHRVEEISNQFQAFRVREHEGA